MSADTPSTKPSPTYGRIKLKIRSFRLKRILISSKRIFPQWAIKAASQKRNWKRLARCWFASWVCFILLLPEKTLAVMGNAAFFVCIAGFFAPPAMSFQLYGFSMLILVTGSLVGWAWGCIAITAAVAARDKVMLESSLRAANQAAASQANPDAYFQQVIFQADFLDTRSSVVYGVFLAVGAFVMGLVRVKVPKLFVASIFGSIFIDVSCSYSPLYPFRDYLVVQPFLVSVLIAVGVNLISVVLIFPETLSHEWLDDYVGVLGSIRNLIDVQETVLTDRPEQLNVNTEGNTLSKVNAIQAGVLNAFRVLSAKTTMLDLEFSYGRLSGADVQSLELPLRALVTRARGLSSFTSQYAHHLCTRADSLPSAPVSQKTSLTDDTTQSGSRSSKPRRLVLDARDTHLLLHVRGHVTALEIAQHTHITDLIPILYNATAELRTTLSGALGKIIDAVKDINERRYGTIQLGPLQELHSARDGLKRALAEYKNEHRVAIVQSLANAVDAASGRMLDKHGRPTVSFRPLFVCFSFESNLCWTADGVLALMGILIKAMEERNRNRLWAPTGLRNIMKVLRRGEGTSPIVGDQSSLPEPGKDDAFSRKYRKDPDARPAVTVVQHLTRAMWNMWRFTRSTETEFAIKYAIVSVVLWLPTVFKSSAAFVYREKALWALFMGQFALSIFMSDQIGQVVSRLLGTVGGGCVGVVVWYIGAGRGHGNPYGLAAAFGVFSIPLLFARLFWTQRVMETIVASITAILVVGYSLIDVHLNPVANLGYGYQIFWKRILVMCIGFTAGFVLMLLPPRSARKAIRLGNASTISEISQIYGILISSWLTIEEDAEDRQASGETDLLEKTKSVSLMTYNKWAPAFRAKLLSVAGHLGAQRAQMLTIRWERNIRGGWPGEHYEKLLEIQATMLSDLIQLAGSLTELSPAWRNRLLHKTAFLNPNLISDVMAIFSIVSMSLETGHPVHEVLPSNLLDRSLYHDEQSRAVGTKFRQLDLSDGEEVAESTPITGEPITGKQVMSMEYSAYATGVSASFHLLHSLDEIHLITKELCGEIPLNGYSRWREEYELKHLDYSV